MRGTAPRRNGLNSGSISILHPALRVAIETLEARQLLSAAVHQAAKTNAASTRINKPTFRVALPNGKYPYVSPLVSSAPAGVTPSQMRKAYGVDVTLLGNIVGDGTGQTIAIVDAYKEPTMAADLAAFDNAFGLQAPPALIQVNQTGGSTLPASDSKGGWGVETALDVEWAHVMAPNATILLVSATSANDADLYAAVDTARNYAGVSAVSMSWGGDETSSDSANDSHFTTPSGHGGVTFFSSSGDNGAYSDQSTASSHPVIVGYPAASSNVVSVGGTYLTTATDGTYTTEAGWGSGTTSYTNGGSGGGISQFITQPSYQSGKVTGSTTKRTLPDISLDADPNSGVPVYSAYDNGASTPWLQVGGTSLSSPMWAGVMAVVNQGRAAAGLGSLNGASETLPRLYSLASTDFHDITSGSNGPYTAAAGYDLVTGRGTPIVNKLVPDLVAAGTPTIGSLTAGDPSNISLGGYVSLYAKNVTDSGGSGTISNVTFYRESNSTSGLQTASGTAGDTVVGTGIKNGTTFTLLASSTGLSAGTYTFYAVASDGVTNSTASSVSVTIGGTGFSNWSTIGQYIAKVPLSIGAITQNISVVNFGNTVYTGPIDITNTLNRMRADDGPIETNDGQSFANSGNIVPSGTWYEFTVDPQTGSSPSFTTSQVAKPGPMRLLLDTKGDLYFSGDHYDSAVLVYAAGTPTIGSLAANPTTVNAGTPSTLTASGVTESGGTISTVQFYRESNGSSGLQIGSDALVGTGTVNGTTWTISAPTTGLASGTYTYYAVATDTAGASSATASTTLSVTAAPTIGSFALSPASIATGGTTTLTATNVAETGSTITGVNFYRESNGTTGLQTSTDTLVGAGTANGSTWTLPITAGAVGSYTYYAVATDNNSISSAASSAKLTVTSGLTGSAVLAWEVNGQSSFGTQGLAASAVATGISNSLGLTRASGVTATGSSTTNAWGGSNWSQTTSAAGITANQFISFGATVSTGEILSLTSVDMNYRHSGTGPTSGFWQYQLNGGAWSNIVNGDVASEFSSSSSNGAAMAELDLSSTAGLQSLAAGTAVNIRLVPYAATGSGGSFYVYDLSGSGNDLVVNGVISAATVSPTIGSFSIAPSPAIAGAAVTLTAGTVAETGGTINAVNFYRESNSTSGLQTGGDTFVGTGTQNGSTWTFATTAPAAGSYTYYAVAVDSASVSSPTSTAALTVTNPTPVIGSFTINPSGVTVGTPATLTASNVVETGGSISNVKFYVDANNNGTYQAGVDTLVGTGNQSGSTWTLSVPNNTAGTYTYLAVATDASNNTVSASATLTVAPVGVGTPTITALTVGPSAVAIGGTTSLTASGVSETNGTISSVAFYRESNSSPGYQAGGDTLVGSGTQSGKSWTLNSFSTASLAAGSYTLYAVATDALSTTSSAVSATMTVLAAGGSGDIVGFDTHANTTFGSSPQAASTASAALASTVGLTRGSGVTTINSASARCWGGNGFSTTTAAAGITANEFLTFGLTVKSGYSLSLSGFDMSWKSSGSGPTAAQVDYSLNGAAYSTLSSNVPLTRGSSGTITELAITTLNNLPAGSTVTFRVTPYGSGSGGNFYVFDQANTTADDIFVNGTATAAATSPTLAFHASTFAANETDGTATITVDRTGDTTGASTVQYLASDNTATAGTDYTATAGTLSFAAGETSKTFTIALANVAAPAGTRSVNLALFNPASPAQTGATATAVLTITDNAAPVLAFHTASFSVNATAGTATITVDRTGDTTQSASVLYSTADGSAVAGTDYTATNGTVSFTAGQTSETFTVAITNVLSSTTTSKTVNLSLSSPSAGAGLGAQSTAVLTIVVNAAPTLAFSAASYAVNESDGTATIAVTRGGDLTSAVSVHYATSDGSATAGTDYTAASGTLSFAANQSTATFTVALAEIAAPAGVRTVNLSLTSPSANALLGAQSTAVVNITDNVAPVLSFDAAEFAVNENDGTATITVDRTGGTTQAVSVLYATSDGSATAGVDYIATTGTLTFAAGATTATFTVPVLKVVTFTPGVVTVNLTLSTPSANAQLGSQNTAVLKITDDAAPRLPGWLDPNSAATWNAATSTLTVTGATTILSDPLIDEPNIVADGAAAQITVPAADVDLAYHVGGISLTNGATFSLTSLTTARTEANHRVLMIGIADPTTTPTFSIDSTSTLNLADNDLILTHAAATTQMGLLSGAIASAADGTKWDHAGLTSSAAAADPQAFALGYAESSTIGVSSFDGQSLGTGGAVIVKYTLIGDTQLTGSVGLGDYTTVIRNFGQSGVGWSDGNFDYTGTVGLGDYTEVIRNFGRSMS